MPRDLDPADPLDALDLAVGAMEAGLEEDASFLRMNELEHAVETAWERLSEASADGLDDRIRSRFRASLEAPSAHALPSQWLAVLVTRIGASALPELLAATAKGSLVDGTAVNALLSDVVGRHPEEALTQILSALRGGPLKLPALVALSYLPPDEGPALEAGRAALADRDPTARAVAATYLGHSDWWGPLADSIRTLAKEDPDEAVRAAAKEAVEASEDGGQ